MTALDYNGNPLSERRPWFDDTVAPLLFVGGYAVIVILTLRVLWSVSTKVLVA